MRVGIDFADERGVVRAEQDVHAREVCAHGLAGGERGISLRRCRDCRFRSAAKRDVGAEVGCIEAAHGGNDLASHHVDAKILPSTGGDEFLHQKILVPDAASLSTIFGIVFFMAFQTVLIYRHSRVSETDSKFPKVYWLLAAVTLAAVILFATGVVGLTVATVLAYAAFVISSTVVGILAPGKGYYPAPNASLIRWGMVAFFFGDVLVGLAMLSGEDHSTVQTLAEIANNFIWWVYVPAQLMLIRGAIKSEK